MLITTTQLNNIESSLLNPQSLDIIIIEGNMESLSATYALISTWIQNNTLCYVKFNHYNQIDLLPINQLESYIESNNNSYTVTFGIRELNYLDENENYIKYPIKYSSTSTTAPLTWFIELG